MDTVPLLTVTGVVMELTAGNVLTPTGAVTLDTDTGMVIAETPTFPPTVPARKAGIRP